MICFIIFLIWPISIARCSKNKIKNLAIKVINYRRKQKKVHAYANFSPVLRSRKRYRKFIA